jgi:hypothetical protein
MLYGHDLGSGRVNGCFWREADIGQSKDVGLVPISEVVRSLRHTRGLQARAYRM